MRNTVEGWKRVDFGNVLTLIRNGYSGKQIGRMTKFPVSRIETISNGSIDLVKVGYVETIPGSYLLKVGDILFSNINSLKHIGKAAQVKNGTYLFHGMNLLIFRAITDVDMNFLFFKLIEAKPWFEKMATQAVNQASINQATIKELQLNIPNSKSEQTTIAEVISTVDRAIEQTEGLIAKLQRIKTGLMNDLLTRGIDEQGNLRSEETHKFKDSPLGRIPIEWEAGTLSYYIGFIRSGLSRRILDEDVGVPVITSTNIQNSQLDTTQLSYWYLKDPQGAKTESFFLDNRDILLNFINSVEQIGKVCMFQNIGRPTIYTTNIFRIKASRISNQEFLFHLLESQVVQNEIKLITKPAVNQASFTTGDFLGISVPLVPNGDQSRIVEFLSVLNRNHNDAWLNLAKLKHIKTALMQDLLTGKVRVTPLLTEQEGNA